ncbi:hypothetical protein [Streptomyces zagrosensis]|uniref:Uncharacterized protein n=1 Tax=Streptomyces zagrosensis TaxID=1042984 RepID=A0A7W9QAW4_9ACTN|nr:hypothetical protein [Streptomyces zagrosensis]MBB5935877.1 hypothetical protein [Streptomyces zagrosensis]
MSAIEAAPTCGRPGRPAPGRRRPAPGQDDSVAEAGFATVEP